MQAHELMRQHATISRQLISVFYLERLLACHYLMAKKLAQILQQDKQDSAKVAKIDQLNKELLDSQGSPQAIGGYYLPDPVQVSQAMRPSPTLNNLING